MRQIKIDKITDIYIQRVLMPLNPFQGHRSLEIDGVQFPVVRDNQVDAQIQTIKMSIKEGSTLTVEGCEHSESIQKFRQYRNDYEVIK